MFFGQVGPNTVAYHVQVNYAESGELADMLSQCEEAQGEELSEEPVLEDQVSVNLASLEQKMPITLLCWPEEHFSSCLIEEVEFLECINYQHTGQGVVKDSTCHRPALTEISTKKCPIAKKDLSPFELPPRIRIKAEPILPCKSNRPSKYQPREPPKMKITFSTCTVVYQPAQPVYENYKERRTSTPGGGARLPLSVRSAEKERKARRSQNYF